MVDTDIIVAGFGMFGGRGEYTCKLKLFDLGSEGGGFEKEGTLIAEVDDVGYECPAKSKYNVILPTPVMITSGKWYLVAVKISGPSSDCGSSGQTTVTTSDNVTFTFKASKKSNNGTDICSGQIPSIIYRVVTQDKNQAYSSYSEEPVCKISKHFGNTLSKDCFENLVILLNWSWSTFKISTIDSLETKKANQSTISLNRLVYICKATLRLLRKYINEIYPYNTFTNVERQALGKSKISNCATSSKEKYDKSPKNKVRCKCDTCKSIVLRPF
jgi:E3 ubiquitin-protein ligase MYCBP2